VNNNFKVHHLAGDVSAAAQELVYASLLCLLPVSIIRDLQGFPHGVTNKRNDIKCLVSDPDIYVSYPLFRPLR